MRSIRSALSWVREHWRSGSAYDSSSGFRVGLFWETSKMFPSCINEILLTAHSLEEWFLSLTPQNSFRSFENEAEEYLTQMVLREMGDRTLNPESPITGMMAVGLGGGKRWSWDSNTFVLLQFLPLGHLSERSHPREFVFKPTHSNWLKPFACEC